MRNTIINFVIKAKEIIINQSWRQQKFELCTVNILLDETVFSVFSAEGIDFILCETYVLVDDNNMQVRFFYKEINSKYWIDMEDDSITKVYELFLFGTGMGSSRYLFKENRKSGELQTKFLLEKNLEYAILHFEEVEIKKILLTEGNFALFDTDKGVVVGCALINVHQDCFH